MIGGAVGGIGAEVVSFVYWTGIYAYSYRAKKWGEVIDTDYCNYFDSGNNYGNKKTKPLSIFGNGNVCDCVVIILFVSIST